MINFIRLKIRNRDYIPYFLLFIVSVTFNYLPDIVPYYFSHLSSGDLNVIGPLSRFAEPCPDSQKGDWICRVQYRLPKQALENFEYLGAGIILFKVEGVCAGDESRRITIYEPQEDGRVFHALRIYHVTNLRFLNCPSDLILKNWSQKTFQRYGYSQAPAVTGSKEWVERVKYLVELAVAGLIAALFFSFTTLYLILKKLQGITRTSLTEPPFDDFRLYWVGFIVLSSGYLLEIIFPLPLPLFVIPKLTNFFGLMCIAGPTTLFIALNNRAVPIFQKSFHALTAGRYGLFPLVTLSAVLMSLPFFRFIYPYAILFCGVISIIGSIRIKTYSTLFYGIALISDGLKILMIPGLPASRVMITYMLFMFALNMRRQISALEEDARFDAGSNIALQIAHDLRSPIGVLKNVIPMLTGPADVKELAIAANVQTAKIADQYLSKFRDRTSTFNALQQIGLQQIISESISEKITEIASPKISITRQFQTQFELYVLINAVDFKRIISNILNNSIDAIGENAGMITVTLSKNAQMAEIAIVDNGCGIPEEILTLVGRKGLTNKPNGLKSGHGTGLHHAKQLISQWGGELSVFSQKNRFTEVRIILPVA